MKVAVAGIALCLVLAGCSDSDYQSGATTASIDRSTTFPSSTSTTTRADAEEMALVERFRAFAREPSAHTGAAAGFAPSVDVGLGSEILTTIDEAELTSAERWVVDREPGFRGYAGPFDVLSKAATAGEIAITIGDHPHCASPPVPPPDRVTDLRRISYQPELPADASCLQWWTVDLFVDQAGLIHAVTLDLWEP